MKSRITKTVALAALMAGAAGVANATEGWYGRADLGYSTGGEFDITTSGWNYGAPDLEAEMTQHLGLGYAFQNGLRLEGEVGHRWNELESTPSLDSGGDIHAWSAMLNLFYDFNRGSRVNPYIGVGVGGVRLNMNGADSAPPPVFSFDDEDTVLGYQAMIGLGIGITEQLTLDVGYRALWAPEVEFISNQPAPVTREADYEHQAITVGLRWQFAGAAPPPPPPPPPVAPPPPPPPPQAVQTCPTGNYTVYFEWDRSTLNAEALAVVDRAVSSLANCNLNGVVLVGHTDTSGSTTYNQALSERRASVVRDALVARGVGAAGIRTEARGESDLARPTGDGVRDPLNRRTAITITFR